MPIAATAPSPTPNPAPTPAKGTAEGARGPHDPRIVGLPTDAGTKFGEFVKDVGEKIGSGIKDIFEGLGHIDPKQAGTGGAWKRPDVVVKPWDDSRKQGTAPNQPGDGPKAPKSPKGDGDTKQLPPIGINPNPGQPIPHRPHVDFPNFERTHPFYVYPRDNSNDHMQVEGLDNSNDHMQVTPRESDVIAL